MDDRVYVGAEDVEITVNMNADISTATVFEMHVYRDGTEVTWASFIYNDRYLRYVTAAGELDIAAEYYIQGYFELPSGFKGWSRTVSFTVHPRWR